MNENDVEIMSLNTGEEPTFHEYNPPSMCNICFNDGSNEIGKITWDDGVMRFEGNAEESAKIFFNEFFKLYESSMRELDRLQRENTELKEKLK